VFLCAQGDPRLDLIAQRSTKNLTDVNLIPARKALAELDPISTSLRINCSLRRSLPWTKLEFHPS